MNKITIGIIGAGYIGGVHASVLLRDSRAQIVSIFDILAERAQALALTTGATIAKSAHEVIEKSDAVFITTPNTQHTRLALAAIAANKHIFCEKPMATSLEEAEAILQAVSRSQKVFQVGHNRRFAPVYASLKKAIEDGLPPHSAHIKMNRGELLNPVWVGNPQITGGFLYETPIHLFDMMRFLFGEVARLDAIGSSHEYKEVDDFSLLLGFANGMHATFATSADASWLFPFERIEVFAHHGTIVTREMESIIFSEGLEGKHRTMSMHYLPKEEKWGYAKEDKAFLDAIERGEPALVTALDGYKSVELVNACYEAIRHDKRITFS
jgi:myo-inositol 2-dehydrogenase/D-chiro-inositol 1-dehydrogenase